VMTSGSPPNDSRKNFRVSDTSMVPDGKIIKIARRGYF
jgi:hypothetical protein